MFWLSAIPVRIDKNDMRPILRWDNIIISSYIKQYIVLHIIYIYIYEGASEAKK